MRIEIFVRTPVTSISSDWLYRWTYADHAWSRYVVRSSQIILFSLHGTPSDSESDVLFFDLRETERRVSNFFSKSKYIVIFRSSVFDWRRSSSADVRTLNVNRSNWRKSSSSFELSWNLQAIKKNRKALILLMTYFFLIDVIVIILSFEYVSILKDSHFFPSVSPVPWVLELTGKKIPGTW